MNADYMDEKSYDGKLEKSVLLNNVISLSLGKQLFRYRKNNKSVNGDTFSYDIVIHSLEFYLLTSRSNVSRISLPC